MRSPERWAALAVLGWCAAAGAQECGSFFPGRSQALPIGVTARGVAVGDLNGDGVNDVLMTRTSAGQNQVSAHLGQGDGTLAAPLITNVASAEDLALGDFNGDGRLDLVVSGAATDTITLLLGDGAGGLAPQPPISVCCDPNTVTAADFDGDGMTDVAVTTLTPPQVHLYRGGTSGLSLASTTPVGNDPVRPVAADVDQNGTVDLPILFPSGLVIFYSGNGAGGFTPAAFTATSSPATSWAMANLDADPRLEIVVANTDAVTYLDGTSGFSYPTKVKVDTVASKFVVAIDADGDDDQDLVVQTVDGKFRVYAGDGAGSFALNSIGVATPFAVAMIAADVDSDGADDVALLGESVLSRYGRGAGGQLLMARPSGIEGNQKAVVIADFNVDGHQDALVLDPFSALRAYTGDGTGALTYATLTTVTPVTEEPRYLAAGDLNQDGVPDVAVLVKGSVGSPFSSRTYLRQGNGAGTFLSVIDAVDSGADTPAAVLLGDFTNDGWTDALSVFGSSTINAGRAVLAKNFGGTTFGPSAAVVTGADPWGAAVGDLDLDGDLDFAVVGFSSNNVTVALGNGAGAFSSTMVATASGPSSVAILDADEDGVPDLVVGTVSLAGGTMMKGLGPGGGYAPPVSFDPNQTYSVALADVDADGRSDVVLTHVGRVSVRRSLGDGTFAEAGDYAIPVVADLRVADFDEDGAPDLLTIGNNTDVSVILQNDAPQLAGWSDLGSALPGASGAPHLDGKGVLVTGCPGELRLTDAAPASPAMLFLGLLDNPTAFVGGTLVPYPPAVSVPLATDGAGAIALSWAAFPPGLGGVDIFFQYAIADAGAPQGAALSNAVRASSN